MNSNDLFSRPQSGHSFALAALAAAVIGCALAALPVQARERHTTVSGANGRTATRDVSRQGGGVSSSTTDPNGQTASRSVDRSSTGTSATVTGPNGQTATRNVARSATGATGTVTGPNGQSATRTTTRSTSTTAP